MQKTVGGIIYYRLETSTEKPSVCYSEPLPGMSLRRWALALSGSSSLRAPALGGPLSVLFGLRDTLHRVPEAKVVRKVPLLEPDGVIWRHANCILYFATESET